MVDAASFKSRSPSQSLFPKRHTEILDLAAPAKLHRPNSLLLPPSVSDALPRLRPYCHFLHATSKDGPSGEIASASRFQVTDASLVLTQKGQPISDCRLYVHGYYCIPVEYRHCSYLADHFCPACQFVLASSAAHVTSRFSIAASTKYTAYTRYYQDTATSFQFLRQHDDSRQVLKGGICFTPRSLISSHPPPIF